MLALLGSVLFGLPLHAQECSLAGQGAAPPPSVAVYRWSEPTLHWHMHTRDPAERPAGWREEGVQFRLFAAGTAGTAPFYRLRRSDGGYFYTANASEKATAMGAGWVDEGVLGQIATSPLPGTSPLHRFIRSDQRHFYTINKSEGDAAGFTYEGLVGFAVPSGSSGAAGPRQAVEAAFVQVLERSGEAGEIDQYSAQATSGTGVRGVVTALAKSPEYHARFITPVAGCAALTLLYRHLLAREPDGAAWAYLDVAATYGWNWVIDQLVNSQEYTDRFGDRAVPGDPVVAWDAARPGVALDPANAAPVLERDLCLTIAAGSGAAYECGDLRLAHALPTIRTLNKPRTPVLIYNQAHVDPHPIVAAYVSLPAGVAADSVAATLVGSNGGTLATGKWPAWTPGQERRIALLFRARDVNWQTGAHGYTLQVRVTSRASTVATYLARGEIGVVDRQASAFGAGWWLAGLEKLHFLPDGRIFWVGGDGSYRTYRPLGTTPAKWAATHVADRPDTLYTTTHPYAAYERRLPGGTRVIYSGSGHHVATVNRLNHQTSFGYGNDGQLGFISLPLAPGYGSTDVKYNFVYGAAGGRFSGVTSTDRYGNPARTTS
ncbi:MAG TPA: phycobilisome rod-core linker polypeptide, partial [Longimicrobium sp.]